MLKRTATILFFITVFAIGGLGCVTKSMARGDVSDTVNGNYTCDNFNIQLVGVSQYEGDIYKYRYIVSGAGYPEYPDEKYSPESEVISIKNINLLEFGIDGDLVVTETSQIKVYPPGEGGLPTDKWLEGVPQLQVLGITAQSKTEAIPLDVLVAGTNGSIGAVAAHTKAGNKSESCFIQGPVPYVQTSDPVLPQDASVPSSKRVVLNGPEGNVEYCIDFDPRTGCPFPEASVYECANPENRLELDESFVVGSTDMQSDPEGPTTPTFIGDINSDMRCPVGKAAHNPCQWVLLAGRAYGPLCW